MHRPRKLFAVALILAAGSFGAGVAVAQPLEVAVFPAAPTWQDVVVATVTGSGNCPELGEPQVSAGPSSTLVEIDLLDPCLALPIPPLPFALTAELGRLEPGDYTVRVDPPGGGAAVETDFRVHNVTDLGIELPDAPLTDTGPLTFFITGFDACPTIFAQSILPPGNVLEVRYSGECAILPPGPFLFELPVEFGPLAPGPYEIRVLDLDFFPIPAVVTKEVVVHDADGCAPGAEILCLQASRFRVEVEWRDFTGRTGRGQAIPLADRDDTGLFWFFDEENVELTVKVLQGCGVNGSWWVFLASGSTVEYTVTVTDIPTSAKETYSNALGQVPELIADTTAFPCP
jgi:hypothetical protein